LHLHLSRTKPLQTTAKICEISSAIAAQGIRLTLRQKSPKRYKTLVARAQKPHRITAVGYEVLPQVPKFAVARKSEQN
jgi:hypothetical protein